MHDWWRKGYWCFKCLEIGGSEKDGCFVKLQVQWTKCLALMERESPNPERKRRGLWRRKIGIHSNDVVDVVEQWQHSATPTYGPQEDHAQAIKSGHTLKIHMASLDDCMKMKAMVDLQWAAIQIATMAGAAGNPDFFNQPDPPLFKKKMEMWLEDRARARAWARERAAAREEERAMSQS